MTYINESIGNNADDGFLYAKNSFQSLLKISYANIIFIETYPKNRLKIHYTNGEFIYRQLAKRLDVCLSTSQNVKMEPGDTKTVLFENTKKPTLIITKTNALTNKGVPNTSFFIEFEGPNGGIIPLGTFKTDQNGQIIIPNASVGWHIITEKISAQGMSLPSNPVTRKYLASGENSYSTNGTTVTPPSGGNPLDTQSDFVVTTGLDYNLGEEIVNWPLNSIVIIKENAVTGGLLADASFEVRRTTDDISGSSGTVIGRYTPKTITIGDDGRVYKLEFKNYPHGTLIPKKLDLKTKGGDNFHALCENYTTRPLIGLIVGTAENGVGQVVIICVSRHVLVFVYGSYIMYSTLHF